MQYELRRFDHVSDDDLLRRLASLLADSRRTEADLVAHIGEVQERRLYAREASPSMFAYCVEVLHLSEAEAYLRIHAARAAREHPAILDMLGDGRLHLSGIAKLVSHLTRENAASLLARAAHRSKRQIGELLAEIAQRPDAPAVIRRLPARPIQAGWLAANGVPEPPSKPPQVRTDPSVLPANPPAPGADPSVPGADLSVGGADPAVAGAVPSVPAADPAQLRPDGVGSTVTSRPAPAIEPLAPARYKVQFTASAELRYKLERLQQLMPVGRNDLAAVVEQAVAEKLERLERKRFALTKAPRETTVREAVRASRYVSAPLRRAVYIRDGGRCRNVDKQGRRCTERHRLEYHHRYPYGLGGGLSLRNICLMCPAHNQYEAEKDYGRAVISRHRATRIASRSGSA